MLWLNYERKVVIKMKVTNNLITIDFTVSELQLIANSLTFMADHLNEHIKALSDRLECDEHVNKEMVTRCLNDEIESFKAHVQLNKAIDAVIGTTHYDDSSYDIYSYKLYE
jgi:hypothetical protein